MAISGTSFDQDTSGNRSKSQHAQKNRSWNEVLDQQDEEALEEKEEGWTEGAEDDAEWDGDEEEAAKGESWEQEQEEEGYDYFESDDASTCQDFKYDTSGVSHTGEENAEQSEPDTDSVASSASIIIPSGEPQRKSGVSPLNRRRSLRLAEKYGQGGQNVFNLTTQSTIVVKPEIERMETSTRWQRYRGDTKPALQDQDTIHVRALKRKATSGSGAGPSKQHAKWVNWRQHATEQTVRIESPTEPSSSVPPPFLSKQTTTTALRAQLALTALDSVHSASGDEVDAALPTRTVGASPRLKRKATTLQSSAKRLNKQGRYSV